MKGFVVGCATLSIVIGMAARLRVYAGTALPTDQPLRWFVGGLAQDVAISGLLVLALILVARWWPRVAAAMAAIAFFLLAVAQFVLAEASIFFNHSVRAEDLQTGLHPRIFLGSAQGSLLALFVGFVVVYWVALVAIDYRMRRAAVVVRPKRIAVGVVVAAVIAVALRATHQYDTASHPVTAAVLLSRTNALQQLSGDVTVPRPGEPPVNVRRLAASDGRRFVSDSFPLAHQPGPRLADGPRIAAGVKPNIVFFIMEGVRAEEVGAYGGIPGLMPTFDRLAKESLFFADAYSGGAYTPEAELGFWYGLLPSPYEIVIRTDPDVRVWGLPEALQGMGWRDFLWIHPGDQSLYLSSRFYRQHRFKAVDGKSFPDGEPRTSWGYSDKALARHAVRLLDEAEEPFASMVLTVSNHHPYHLPDDAGPPFELPASMQSGAQGRIALNGRRTRSMLQTVHYTDEALGYFLSLAREREWFSRTIFVIAGDHGNSVAPMRSVESQHDLFTLRQRVPMLIYSPLLAPRVIAESAAHVDILPTLLGITGHAGLRAGIGRDVFAQGPRPIVSWNAQSGRVSVLSGRLAYHAAVASSGGRLTTLSDESLTDRLADPRGRRDLLASQPNDAAELRRIAASYLDLYGWLIETGRSGVPP